MITLYWILTVSTFILFTAILLYMLSRLVREGIISEVKVTGTAIIMLIGFSMIQLFSTAVVLTVFSRLEEIYQDLKTRIITNGRI